ncbi:MAG: TolC family protein [Betaproteobacteria bacterium]|nr:TolC family protein [Betaproteobacteria bacterium]
MTSTEFRLVPCIRTVIAFVLGAFVLGGCATVQREARFPEVQSAVADHLGQKVEWNRDGKGDERAQKALRTLLRRELSAEAAVQVALLNNRRLQAKFENLGVAQADLVEAGLLDNPMLGVGALIQDAGTEIDLDIVQNFLGIFTLSARKKIGRAAAERVTLEVSGDVLDLAAQVQSQYYRVVGDAETFGLARQVVTSTEAAAEIAQRQYAAGNLSKREQSLQQAFYAQNLLEVAQVEAQLHVDREKLTRLMGLWGADTGWKFPNRLPEVPATLPTLDQIEKLAISRRMDLAAAKKEAEGLTHAVNLARDFRWLGPLGIGVQFKRDTDGEKSYGPKIELGLPIFNQGQTRIARIESERKRAEEQVAALAVDIRSEARENRGRVMATAHTAKHYQTVLLPLQQTIVAETLKFYNGMLIGVYDLLLASQSQIQTGRQYIAANRDFWLAWTELERVVGGRIRLPTVAGAAEPPSASPTEPSTDAPADNAHQHGDRQS